MRVYVLYDNPYDEGWNVYGIFSSEEKLIKAIEYFTPVSNHELFWAYFTLNDLEKFFHINKQRRYTGYSPVPYFMNEETIKHVDFGINPCGLDSFLQEEERKDSLLLSSALWLSVSAENEDDAIRKGKEMLKDIINQPEDERGWKWLER